MRKLNRTLDRPPISILLAIQKKDGQRIGTMNGMRRLILAKHASISIQVIIFKHGTEASGGGHLFNAFEKATKPSLFAFIIAKNALVATKQNYVDLCK
jgi:hypothetical protein